MEKLYTIKQVCDLLQITRFTLRNWEQKGLIEIIRVNGNSRVKETELLRLMKGGSK